MRMIWMLFMLMVAVKATVAITERPRPLFDALHESGEAREVAERTRMAVAFFVEAVNRVRRAAFVWMARILGGRDGDIRFWNRAAFRKVYVLQGLGGLSKRTINYGLSLNKTQRVLS
ncbi:hypothetical protein HMI48_05485 [Acidithiobacillus ferrooxidans]|uniref:hypothetical protein n=1 Tax=Acidithiobacillus ferrooxidans TaxID=920 RepID=UPI001C06C00E|nr:hypothetical protein [Acidithiobacillus ferrooxidans]MBU2773375.1 hypothetical protein [Acidithiobacillus ferrooxidans]